MSVTPGSNRQAAGANWMAYRARLVHFVRSRVGDVQVAEDIVHDALIKALAKQDTVRDSDHFQAWLYQITRNAIADYFRINKPGHASMFGGDTLEIGEPGHLETATTDNPEADLAACLTPLIDQLPEQYRVPLQLADIEGMKQREVASTLGLSLSGAKSRIQRGRKLLGEILLECCQVEHDSRGRVVAYEPKHRCTDEERQDRNGGRGSCAPQRRAD